MKVTIIFTTDHTHTGQAFDNVVKLEAHSSYGFLELAFADGTSRQFNLSNVFSFATDGTVTSVVTPAARS